MVNNYDPLLMGEAICNYLTKKDVDVEVLDTSLAGVNFRFLVRSGDEYYACASSGKIGVYGMSLYFVNREYYLMLNAREN